MIWRADTTAECDYFNDRWLLFRGRAREEEIGNQWAEGVHQDDLEAGCKTCLSSLKRRETFEMYYRLRRVDGTYRWIFDRGVPFYASDGQFRGYIVLEDINGPAVARQIKELQPLIRLLYMSGFSLPELQRRGRLSSSEMAPGSTEFLQKPFSATQFLPSVEGLLVT